MVLEFNNSFKFDVNEYQVMMIIVLENMSCHVMSLVFPLFNVYELSLNMWILGSKAFYVRHNNS